MEGLSFGHWAIVLIVVLLLFGRGRISETMGDFGKGIHSFRRGLAGDAETKPAPALEKEPSSLAGREREALTRKPD